MVNQTGTLWKNTNGRIEQFRQARMGFEAMTRRLSQATLNTYLDYVDANGDPRKFSPSSATSPFVPDHYARQSELRFISGPGLAGNTSSQPPRPTQAVFFQAPLGFVTDGNAADTANYSGLENLLNTWGYYIEFNSDSNQGLNLDGSGLNLKPAFVKATDRYRFRLMELMQASERMSLYKYTASNPGLKSSDVNGMNWFTDALPPLPQNMRPPTTWSHVLAENIVALVVLPKLSLGDQATGGYTDGSLAPNYSYDSTLSGTGSSDPNLNSKTQLPPLLTVTMVAVDEASFKRFQGTSTTVPTTLALDSLFQMTGSTKDATTPGFAKDLQTLGQTLQANKINYRVFTTDVSIKGAKWSRGQNK